MSSRLGLLFLLLALLPLLSLVVGREEEEAALQGAVREEEGVMEEGGLENVVKREAEPGRRNGENRKECKKQGGKMKKGRCVPGRKRNGKNGQKCKKGETMKKGKCVKQRNGRSRSGKKCKNGEKRNKDGKCVPKGNGASRSRKKKCKNGENINKEGKCVKKKNGGSRSAKRKCKNGQCKGRQGKNPGRKSGRQADKTSCALKALQYARLFEGKAGTVFRQVTRIKGNDKVQGSKKGKKGDFNATQALLSAALGGNSSNPKCDGKAIPTNGTGSDGADALKKLEACGTDIEKACSAPITANATLAAEMDACLATASKFKTDYLACVIQNKQTVDSATLDAACTCIEAIPTADVDKLKACDFKTKNDDALSAKKACKKAVGDCQNAEKKAVAGIDSCKAKNKCGGVGTKEEAEAQLKVLTPLSNALARPEMDNAMKEAGVATGTGADGQVPTGRMMKHSRVIRQDDAGCTSLEGEWAQFNTSATQTAETANSDLNDTAAGDTTTTLNKINDRKTLVADLKGCGTTRVTREDGRQFNVQIKIVKIRFYIFWCGWFRVQVIEIKITIITISFGLPAVTTTTAAPSTGSTAAVTTVGPGRRVFLSNMMRRAAISGGKGNI